MLFPGLVSVTFRQLQHAEIIQLALEAGLTGIEWGGDIHVPHGDLHRARQVRRMTEDAGLRIPSYGSYYRVWPQEPAPFAQVLETAQELGAPLIRVWAGKLGSAEADEDHRLRLADEAKQIAEQASQAGIAVAFEFHRNTLTDTLDSTLDLLKRANHPNLGTYWQPPVGTSFNDNLDSLKAVLPWLRNLHVFQWRANKQQPGETIRLPLADGEAEWRQYLFLSQIDGKDRFAMLEFVREDDPQQLKQDAEALLSWLK